MQHDGPAEDGDALSSLLSMLNNKEPGPPIASVVNTRTINLLCNLLYPEDYISVATRLGNSSDVLNLLDFILHLLRARLLTSPDATTDFNRRARRFMFKIISTNPVIPRSLILTEVKVPAKRDYVGGGAFGGVCKGELRGEIVALKVLYRIGDNVAFYREALMWAMLKHEFVLSFLGIYKQQEEMFLVSPYMENGTLAQWRRNANPSVTETWKRVRLSLLILSADTHPTKILEVARGMEYIHSEGIVHGDLRGDNVLLDANLHVQIADFGLTRLLDTTNTQSGAKHVNFSAPELFGCPEDADNPSEDVEPARTQMSDVYAFGCLYYEIHYNCIPFAGRSEGQIMFLVVIQDKRPHRQDEPPLSDGAWEVIQRCWAKEPWRRPRMEDVIGNLVVTSQSMSLSTKISLFPVTSSFSATTSPPCMDSTLSSLLSVLNDRKPASSIASVVNATTINLIWKLLSREDYVSVVGDLSQASDAKNLLDFMLYLLRDHRLLNQDRTVNIDQRARRFMIKVISKMPVIPPSLIVTGVRMPFKRNFFAIGALARVFKGELRGSTVGLTEYLKPDIKAFCREALMWQFLKHKFVLPFLGIYECGDGMASEFFLVSPYMKNGTLRQWRKQTNPSIAEIEKRILQVAQGLEYIHSEGIVHGSIHGANILMDDSLHVQIGGFGLTRLSAATNTAQSGLFNINSGAPELFGILDNDDTSDDIPSKTQMSDVYAFGCLYYEIHYDTVPFAGRHALQIMRILTRGILPPRLDEPPLSDGAWDMIQRCWTRKPSKRPRMKDVVESLMWLIVNR
ncbi:kinase-like domain-containing protein [Amanita rubescens]|nr:kinase-like domain-containing protein [Amanita rubescens]